MKIPDKLVPIEKIFDDKGIILCIKREDLIHKEISGNKYWKMFYSIRHYLGNLSKEPFIITFGGPYSNHIAATAVVGKKFMMKTLGIIRGEELSENERWRHNPTLYLAYINGMRFRFVSREEYRNKEDMTKTLQEEFPDALIVPEGGTNDLAVEGVKWMLDERTKEFDYLCSAVGTGGTISGLCKYSEYHQKVIGFKAVNDISLEQKISVLSRKENFTIFEAHDGAYGKITDENVRFINDFYQKYKIPLDPVYTGKMMRHLFKLISNHFFPEGSSVLAFHTGGLQGIYGANEQLKKQKRNLIDIDF